MDSSSTALVLMTIIIILICILIGALLYLVSDMIVYWITIRDKERMERINRLTKPRSWHEVEDEEENI